MTHQVSPYMLPRIGSDYFRFQLNSPTVNSWVSRKEIELKAIDFTRYDVTKQSFLLKLKFIFEDDIL